MACWRQASARPPFAGHEVTADPASVRARIGLVTDVPGLYEQMSARAYLDFFGRLYGLDSATRAARIASLLETFELDTRGDERMVTFSRGMQQKVALARALLHEPTVLFLDEPTAGLDPLATRAVRELILGMKHARRSIVLCTHDLDEAERLADQVAIMQSGHILALDTPGALRERSRPKRRCACCWRRRFRRPHRKVCWSCILPSLPSPTRG